jgi:peroxiredoxin
VSQKLALTAIIAVAAAVVGAALVAAVRPAPEVVTSGPAVARRAEEAGRGAEAPVPVALKPRKGRVLTVVDAAKELNLIAPSRQKLAEDFTLPLVGGDTLRLSAERGKVVLINFWATWCPPCREEMPAMERLWRQQKGQGFVLVAVSVDSDTEKVKPYLDEHKLTFPAGLDPKMDLANAYGVRAVPSSFVVDRQGHLTAIALGPREWDSDASHSLIEGLLRSR